MKDKNIGNQKNEDLSCAFLPYRKLQGLFKAKDLFHKQLAKIPFEEKIKILVRLQKIASSIQISSKRKQRVWKCK